MVRKCLDFVPIFVLVLQMETGKLRLCAAAVSFGIFQI